MEKEDINALDEIHKGACMGKDAIHFVREKVEDQKLKDVLDAEYEQYQEISRRIEEIYPKYNDGKPHETSAMNKAMTWYGIEMKTMMDKSNSKITELLLQGVNMGIIEGKKILNNKNLDKEVMDIVSEYVEMQEKSVEVLKEYL
ncbi:MAG: hypothetical protein E7166_02195 [Firmicutes bacterium]|nr:hypothetical protein [Bacillota bacterium]